MRIDHQSNELSNRGRLEPDLIPGATRSIGWGDEIKIDYRRNKETSECSVTRDIVIREGTVLDYRKLSHLHYRAEESRSPIKIYAVER